MPIADFLTFGIAKIGNWQSVISNQ